MKNLKTFDQFINESLIVEGKMTSVVFRNKRYLKELNLKVNWDPGMESLQELIGKKLGESDITKIMQSDENWSEKDDLQYKIYQFLEDNFVKSEQIKNDLGSICEYDKVLHVVRCMDSGFTSYQYVVDSNF
jgi:hypothetical protein